MPSGGVSSASDPGLNEAVQQLRDQIVNFSQRFIQDATVREQYVAKAQTYADQIITRVQNGEISALQGATEAHALRGGLMETSRLKSSDIGRAAAELEKATNKS